MFRARALLAAVIFLAARTSAESEDGRAMLEDGGGSVPFAEDSLVLLQKADLRRKDKDPDEYPAWHVKWKEWKAGADFPKAGRVGMALGISILLKLFDLLYDYTYEHDSYEDMLQYPDRDRELTSAMFNLGALVITVMCGRKQLPLTEMWTTGVMQVGLSVAAGTHWLLTMYGIIRNQNAWSAADSLRAKSTGKHSHQHWAQLEDKGSFSTMRFMVTSILTCISMLVTALLAAKEFEVQSRHNATAESERHLENVFYPQEFPTSAPSLLQVSDGSEEKAAAFWQNSVGVIESKFSKVFDGMSATKARLGKLLHEGGSMDAVTAVMKTAPQKADKLEKLHEDIMEAGRASSAYQVMMDWESAGHSDSFDKARGAHEEKVFAEQSIAFAGSPAARPHIALLELLGDSVTKEDVADAHVALVGIKEQQHKKTPEEVVSGVTVVLSDVVSARLSRREDQWNEAMRQVQLRK